MSFNHSQNDSAEYFCRLLTLLEFAFDYYSDLRWELDNNRSYQRFDASQKFHQDDDPDLPFAE